MNTFNIIYKQAADEGFVSKLMGKGSDFLRYIADKGPAAYIALAGGLVGAGLTAGYGAARLANPGAVSENADKVIASEALQTEIDVTERKLDELMARRAALKKQRSSDSQRYDRFV